MYNTIQLISIIVSGILGIGGLIVAGLSAYWAYSARIEPFKKHLYDRQTHGTSDCVEALVELQLAIESHHANLGYPEYLQEGRNRKSFIKATSEKKKLLKENLYKWSTVLPYDVFLPMTHYLSIVEYASGERDTFDDWAGSSYPHEHPWFFLPTYFQASIAAVRDSLGIDTLGQRLTKSITNDKEDEEVMKKTITEKTQVLGYLMSTDYRKIGNYRVGYIPPSYKKDQYKPDDAKEKS